MLCSRGNDRLRGIIQQRIFALDIRLTISIGVAQLREKEDRNAWLTRADDALFRARNEGRNRVVLAEPAVSLRETEMAALGTGAA